MSARAWPLAMTAVLGTVVGVNIWVAVIANNDPSFAIEPDYYRKAVAWDSVMAQARANDALRWTLTPQLSAYTPGRGATLVVALADDHGVAIRDANVHVTAMHVARAASPSRALLTASDSSTYVTTLPVDRAGWWELRFDVTRGETRFTATARIDAVRAATGEGGTAP